MTKQLKKLSFAKEELVNLNEYEMSHIKGGEQATWTITTSSDPCLAGISATIGITYDIGKDKSWWVCGKKDEQVDDKVEPIELSEIYDKVEEVCVGILNPLVVKPR